MGYRLLGNKTRLAPWIADAVASKVPEGACVADPMCGTASVSRALADRGYAVHAADALLFPTLHAKARLLFDQTVTFHPISDSYEDALALLNQLSGEDGLFLSEYSSGGAPENGSRPRKYFTPENARKIDAIRSRIRGWRSQGVSDEACDLLLHDLILAANAVANIAGTYGYYRAEFTRASLQPLRLLPTTRNVSRGRHQVSLGPVEDLAHGIVADAVYLDPPYTKRQYGGNYHIPETLAQEDMPDPVGEGGLRNWYPQSSDFCSKRLVRPALRETIKRLESRFVFLSYSEDGLIPEAELIEILSDYGTVERRDLPNKRFRSNGGKRGSVFEHLYILEKH